MVDLASSGCQRVRRWGLLADVVILDLNIDRLRHVDDTNAVKRQHPYYNDQHNVREHLGLAALAAADPGFAQAITLDAGTETNQSRRCLA